jgi:hypothetical protein
MKILEQKKFAVFCLARIGCEIIDTQLKFIDKQSTEILFTDKLILYSFCSIFIKFDLISISFSDNVPHNFQLNLEIYALNQSLALSSSAKDFANRYSYFSTHGSTNLSRKRPEINVRQT